MDWASEMCHEGAVGALESLSLSDALALRGAAADCRRAVHSCGVWSALFRLTGRFAEQEAGGAAVRPEDWTEAYQRIMHYCITHPSFALVVERHSDEYGLHSRCAFHIVSVAQMGIIASFGLGSLSADSDEGEIEQAEEIEARLALASELRFIAWFQGRRHVFARIPRLGWRDFSWVVLGTAALSPLVRVCCGRQRTCSCGRAFHFIVQLPSAFFAGMMGCLGTETLLRPLGGQLSSSHRSLPVKEVVAWDDRQEDHAHEHALPELNVVGELWESRSVQWRESYEAYGKPPCYAQRRPRPFFVVPLGPPHVCSLDEASVFCFSSIARHLGDSGYGECLCFDLPISLRGGWECSQELPSTPGVLDRLSLWILDAMGQTMYQIHGAPLDSRGSLTVRCGRTMGGLCSHRILLGEEPRFQLVFSPCVAPLIVGLEHGTRWARQLRRGLLPRQLLTRGAEWEGEGALKAGSRPDWRQRWGGG